MTTTGSETTKHVEEPFTGRDTSESLGSLQETVVGGGEGSEGREEMEFMQVTQLNARAPLPASILPFPRDGAKTPLVTSPTQNRHVSLRALMVTNSHESMLIRSYTTWSLCTSVHIELRYK